MPSYSVVRDRDIRSAAEALRSDEPGLLVGTKTRAALARKVAEYQGISVRVGKRQVRDILRAGGVDVPLRGEVEVRRTWESAIDTILELGGPGGESGTAVRLKGGKQRRRTLDRAVETMVELGGLGGESGTPSKRKRKGGTGKG